MCSSPAVIVIHDKNDALGNIEAALAAGDVDAVLGQAQCFWVLCKDETELEQCFRTVIGLVDHLLDNGSATRLIAELQETADCGRSLLAVPAA